jgi:hypothetical protein
MRPAITKLLFCFIAIFFFLPGLSQAAFSVRVAPYEGGFVLDFGKSCFSPETNAKEVTVAITSDAGKQYRLLETLMEPLTSANGATIGQGNFVVSSIRGSNGNGTLLTDFETPVTMSPVPLYVSNQQGSPDSFTLAYALKGPCSAPSGVYRGKIRFSLEPADAPIQRVDTFLDVIAEIENNSSSVTVAAPGGMKLISVKLTKDGVEPGGVVFSFKNPGNTAGARISQVFTGVPTSSDGSELPLEAITVLAGDGPVAPVTLERQVLFPSLPVKDGEVAVQYGLSDAAVKAGLYRSTLKFMLEGAGPSQEIGSFAFEASIDPVFDMKISTEDGGGTINFHGLKPDQPSRSFTVTVAVKNNTGKKYQVTQKVLSGLATKEGRVIGDENFTVLTEKTETTKGTPKITAKTQMKSGDQVLFISDKHGSPDSFQVVYELSATHTTVAGDYSASVVYSLSEL